MTDSRAYRDFYPAPLIPAAGLTLEQCRRMQAVVLHSFMEESHQPVAAREILEALGLACHFHEDEGREPPLASEPVELLWDHSNGLTAQPKRKGVPK